MARYIDADALYKKLYPLDLADKRKYTINAKAVADAIDNTPTADVVPKSEVERLVQDVTRLEQENETLKDNNEHLAVMLEEAKQELAREIFEELARKSTYVFPTMLYTIAKRDVDELKNKYIGESDVKRDTV